MIDPTPEMVAAGEAVIFELAGEVSKATLAREVWNAMSAASGKPVNCLECGETFFVGNGKRADAKFCCPPHRIKFKNRRNMARRKADAQAAQDQVPA